MEDRGGYGKGGKENFERSPSSKFATTSLLSHSRKVKITSKI